MDLNVFSEFTTLSDENYNIKVEKLPLNSKKGFRDLYNYTMLHTEYKCKFDEKIVESIKKTKEKQFIVFDNDYDGSSNELIFDGPTQNIIISKKKTFEAARAYKGKKVAVLNFANNRCAGGTPFLTNTQEDNLCRSSTLYACLKKEQSTFYDYHSNLYNEGKLDNWGNGDLIYSPDVLVFKSDNLRPKMLKPRERFYVDVITLAAPQFWGKNVTKDSFKERIKPRLRKMFEVAKESKVKVLILGAWGCGAFNNPPQLVAEVFKELCAEYRFDTIEFAIFCNEYETNNYEVFERTFKN